MINKRLYTLIQASLNSSIPMDLELFEGMNSKTWIDLMELAKSNGLKYLIFDAISLLPEKLRPADTLYIKWYLETENSEARFLKYTQILEELAQLMANNSIPLMLMKGYTIAMTYPTPARREGGDFDIYLFDNHSKGDSILKANCEVSLEFNSDSCHSNFFYQGISVENHKHFFTPDEGFLLKVNTYTKAEKTIIDGISNNRISEIKVGEQTIKVLEPNLAIFHHIIHTLKHTVGVATALRQYTDWVVLFNHYRDRLDREWLLEKIKECNVETYIANVESFLKENIGFEPFFNIQNKKIYKGRYSIGHLAFNQEEILISRHEKPIAHITQLIKKFYTQQRLYNVYLGDKGWSLYFIPQLTRKIKRFLGFRN